MVSVVDVQSTNVPPDGAVPSDMVLMLCIVTPKSLSSYFMSQEDHGLR